MPPLILSLLILPLLISPPREKAVCADDHGRAEVASSLALVAVAAALALAVEWEPALAVAVAAAVRAGVVDDVGEPARE